MEVSINNQVSKTEPDRVEGVLDQRCIFHLGTSVGRRGLLTSECIESAKGTGRANRPIPGRGVGRAGHRDVCAVRTIGGLE